MTTFKNPVFENHSLVRVFLELSSLPEYQDTKLICSDGEVCHNRLFILLMFPQIIPCEVLGTAGDDTILLPDFTVAALNQEIQWAIDLVEKSKSKTISDKISVIHAKNEPSTLPENLCQVKVEDDEHSNGDLDLTNDQDLTGKDEEMNIDDNGESNHTKPFSINEMLATLAPADAKDTPELPPKSPHREVALGVINDTHIDIKKPKQRQKRKRNEETKTVDDNECYFKAPPGPAVMNQELGPGSKKKRKERKRKDPTKPINPYKEKDDMSKPYKPVKMTYKDKPKDLMCDFCPYRTYHISNLTNHKRTHTGEKPYPCSLCGDTFRFSGVRNLHMKTHTGEKEYACQYCGKEFARRYVMILHERTHTGEKPFSCDFCGKRFTRHSTKINHEKSHKTKKDIPDPEPSPSTPVDIDQDDKSRISTIVENTSEVEQGSENRSPPPTPEKHQHRSVILATNQAHLYDEKPRVITPLPRDSISSLTPNPVSTLQPTATTSRPDLSIASHPAMSPHHSAMSPRHPAMSPRHPVMLPRHPVMLPRHPAMSPHHPAMLPHEMYEDKPIPHFSNVKSPQELEHMEEESYGPSSPLPPNVLVRSELGSPLPPNMMARSELASAYAQAQVLERLQRSSIINPVQAHALFQNYGQQGKSSNHL